MGLPSQIQSVTAVGQYQYCLVSRSTYVWTTCLQSLSDCRTAGDQIGDLQIASQPPYPLHHHATECQCSEGKNHSNALRLPNLIKLLLCAVGRCKFALETSDLVLQSRHLVLQRGSFTLGRLQLLLQSRHALWQRRYPLVSTALCLTHHTKPGQLSLLSSLRPEMSRRSCSLLALWFMIWLNTALQIFLYTQAYPTVH